MILGIDPSYSSTGIALSDDNYSIVLTKRVCNPGKCYSSITENHSACKSICSEIESILVQNGCSDVDVICEYPAFATRSGAYLAILNGYLSCYFEKSTLIRSVTWVTPNACDSFTMNKAHSKSFLVSWCKDRGFITKRVSHDECTAIIFIQLLKTIRESKWKNAYFVNTKSV